MVQPASGNGAAQPLVMVQAAASGNGAADLW